LLEDLSTSSGFLRETFIKGQRLRVETVSNPLAFIVVSTQPSGPVMVARNTSIVVKEKVIEELMFVQRISLMRISGD